MSDIAKLEEKLTKQWSKIAKTQAKLLARKEELKRNDLIQYSTCDQKFAPERAIIEKGLSSWKSIQCNLNRVPFLFKRMSK